VHEGIAVTLDSLDTDGLVDMRHAGERAHVFGADPGGEEHVRRRVFMRAEARPMTAFRLVSVTAV
jgi:hypothetical protein